MGVRGPHAGLPVDFKNAPNSIISKSAHRRLMYWVDVVLASGGHGRAYRLRGERMRGAPPPL